MTCDGFCVLRPPIPKVSAVPFELHFTTSPCRTRTAVYSVCLVIPGRRRLHLDSAHRRPHAYLNIATTIVAELVFSTLVLQPSVELEVARV